MDNKNNFQEVVIAALLHDVGKFYQRTQYKPDKSLEVELCPRAKGGYYSHQHVLFTYKFIEDMKLKLPKGVDFRQIANLAGHHHKPNTDDVLQEIIRRADWISSGADRSEKETDEEHAMKYYEKRMASVFDKIYTHSSRPDKQEHRNYYSLNALAPDSIFPDKKEGKIDQSLYTQLWEKFITDLQYIPADTLSFEEYLTVMDSLLERYTWCIPSTTVDDPDISLYDHLATTTAFAAVLYRYHEAKDTFSSAAINDSNDKKFLFVSGDMSGIQRYLFNLKNTKRNAKILRARSFEIQSVTEGIVQELLARLELPHVCRIMNAGGRFLLVLPNTQTVKDTLEEFRAELDKHFLKNYFGELVCLITNGVEFSQTDLEQGKMEKVFRLLHEDVANSKNTKFQAAFKKEPLEKLYILEDEYSRIEGAENVCDICGCRAKVKEYCITCDDIITFGEKLPKARYMAYTKKNIRGLASLPLPFGWKVCISDTVKIFESEHIVPHVINDREKHYPAAYMPYYVPSKADSVLDFEDIAEKSEGNKKIAMFKADVDSLGFIFSSGLDTKTSISRFSTMSRMLHYFFSAYVNHVISHQHTYIYTVFSGGDDLCVIGPWDKIIEFSLHIQEEFTRYVGNNPDITISGGIALASHNLPVKYMAENSEDNLKISKKADKKNSVTVFDTTVNWLEFSQLIKDGRKLDNYIKNKELSKSMAYRLIHYADMRKEVIRAKHTRENGKVLIPSVNSLLWRSHLKYDSVRNINKNSKHIRDFYVDIVERDIEGLYILASYALYLNR